MSNNEQSADQTERGPWEFESWADLPGLWVAEMREEWERRTTWGKMLYPGWVLGSALLWVFLLIVLFPAWMNDLVDHVAARIGALFPEVYKEDAE